VVSSVVTPEAAAERGRCAGPPSGREGRGGEDARHRSAAPRALRRGVVVAERLEPQELGDGLLDLGILVRLAVDFLEAAHEVGLGGDAALELLRGERRFDAHPARATHRPVVERPLVERVADAERLGDKLAVDLADEKRCDDYCRGV